MATQFRSQALTRTVDSILDSLPDRHREVIERRYGFGDDERETLESIGEDFGITRERVRQIEEAGFSMLKKGGAQDRARDFFADVAQYLESFGHLRREEKMLSELSQEKYHPHVLFLLDLGDPFFRHNERDWHWDMWGSSNDALGNAKSFLDSLCARLEEVGRAMQDDDLLALSREVCRKQNVSISDNAIWSYIDLSKAVEQGPFGEWGFVEWPAIRPKGVRDRAYLVLLRKNKPMHFGDIAESISGLAGRTSIAWPEANTQTVHNELLKDDRIVLVGRGIYALKQWGYEPGTVKDVLVSILSSAPRPLTKDEVLAEVMKRRIVKSATALLNLYNRKYFSKTADGRYTVSSR